jgi:uroporphyrinogen decarboxylase
MLSYGVPDDNAVVFMTNYIRKLVGDRYLLICHGDATFAIPSGSDMVEFAAAFFERPDEMHEIARKRVQWALKRGKWLREECGIDGSPFAPTTASILDRFGRRKCSASSSRPT